MKEIGKKLLRIMLMMAMVVGLLPGMGLTAYAAGGGTDPATPTEELLTTITATGKEQANYSTANVATVSFSNLPNCSSYYTANWGWWGCGWSATVNAAEGYTITKCVFYDNKDNNATDSEAPFVVETAEDNKMPKVNGSYIYPYSDSAGVKKIEVYGYDTPTTVDVTGVSLDKTTEQSITVGGNVAFTATVAPEDATDKTVKWSVGGTDTGAVKLYSDANCENEIGTDATDVLTVYAKGILAGSATVTVASNSNSDKSASCAVTVNAPVPVASVTPYNGAPTEYTDFAAAVTAWNNASDGGGYASYGATLTLLTDMETNSSVMPNKQCLSDYPMTLDLNGYGIRYTGTTNNSVININDGCSLKLIDSNTSRKHYITLDENGRGTAVSDTTSEGAIEVTGGYITGGLGKDGDGGGIYVMTGCVMEGGTIVGNTASNGGGVRIGSAGGRFTMKGGTITNNTASNGGGVYFGATCVFNLSGGTITGNKASTDGGGVYVTGGATFNLSGGAIIKDNLKGSDKSNVYLNNGRKISVTDTLTNSVPIGVTMQKAGVFTSSPGEAKAKDYAANFSSDDSTYSVITDGDELKLGTHVHNFTYTADGATITATCGNSNCNLTDNKVTLTIVKPTLEIYHGTGEASATLTGLDAFNTATGKTVAATEIKYVGRSDTTYSESTTAPTNAGKYTAKITLTGVKTSEGEGKSVTASVDYEIAKADPTAIAPTNLTATYGDTLASVNLPNPEGNTPGTWTWKADSTTKVGNAGNNTFKANFTPTDAANYNDKNDVDIVIAVSKASAPEVVVPTPDAVTYDAAKTLASVALVGDWEWVDSTIVPTVNNSGYSASLAVDDANYDYSQVAGYDQQTHKVIRVVSLTVNKADWNVTAPERKSPVYNKQTQELVTAGTVTGGTMKYAIGTSGTSAPTDGWLDSVPTGINAGNYYVWYKVDGDENHNSVDPVCLTVSIAKAKATITDNQKPKAVTGLEADETDHALVTAPAETVTGYSVKYSLDGTNWSDSIPTGKDAGTYTVKVKYVATDQNNYDDVNGDDISVKITTVSYTAVKGNGLVWTKGSGVTADFEFARSVESAERTAFSLFSKVQVDGNDVDASNYDKQKGSVIIKFKPAYLEKLSVGEHKVTAFFRDNHTASANFTVKEKQSSGGGSSTPEKKTDNVVTCQMAGYPANYAWNEAAKACQPGYLDNNGVFHSTARKSVVPGTYDRGIAGNVISLTVSAFFAVAALFLLRKYK